ncbi:Uncharacterised protein [Mycobacteroides abscessus subsp. abscessus]|nr:Uncharacterised protein [Mycobacteroides abscessus subsp. abscessus]
MADKGASTLATRFSVTSAIPKRPAVARASTAARSCASASANCRRASEPADSPAAMGQPVRERMPCHEWGA